MTLFYTITTAPRKQIQDGDLEAMDHATVEGI